ncbi:MAG: alpha/beta fold hydrolase [Pseudobdellovibrio sp.]
MEILEKNIDILGGQIYVKSWKPSGSDSKSPIILLHDSLGCVEMWRQFPQALAEKLGRQIIAYDRLGFGRSTKRDENPSVHFVSEEAENHFQHLLSALKIERFILLGHSVGGAMAVIIAGHFEAQCEAIITESAQAFVEDRTKEGITKAKENFSDPAMREKLEKYHGDKTNWVLSAWIDVWLSNEFSTWSLELDLPKVKCPSLVIHGELDEYGSSRFPDMISSLVSGPSKKVIVTECGHVPHREKQVLILNYILDFIEKI